MITLFITIAETVIKVILPRAEKERFLDLGATERPTGLVIVTRKLSEIVTDSGARVLVPEGYESDVLKLMAPLGPKSDSTAVHAQAIMAIRSKQGVADYVSEATGGEVTVGIDGKLDDIKNNAIFRLTS